MTTQLSPADIAALDQYQAAIDTAIRQMRELIHETVQSGSRSETAVLDLSATLRTYLQHNPDAASCLAIGYALALYRLADLPDRVTRWRP
jgi:hypothetical protein